MRSHSRHRSQNNNRIMGLLFLILVVALPVSAQTWRLQELGRASNALVFAMDQLLAHKKASCGLDAAGVSQASQNLKALIDQRVQELSAPMDKRAEVAQLLKSCAQDCTCETYEYALEKMTGIEHNSSPKLTAEKRKACVARATNFCQSKIFKAIK